MTAPADLFTPGVEEALLGRLAGQTTPLFLDYDGTLTPIVDDPAQAVLSPQMRDVLGRLAEVHTVALVSGRDLTTLRDFVGLNSVYYAGSHGFDIAGPGDLRQRNAAGEACVAALDQAQDELQQRLGSLSGWAFERKAFALAIHYRHVAEAQRPTLTEIVQEIGARYTQLRVGKGKMVFELQPDVAWDKGRAVLWLLEALGLDRPHVTPLYFGDDWTDEDAFRALQGRGIGVFVGELERETAAEYRLASVEHVGAFFERLLQGGSAA
ncbi:trehalose-phosphatase [Halorhodospira abdelmalekii]|uniref:trehalose-phosphatase n=1 Tax=Halorhodospira abdelmalekii TaxID=421629 RepID=UPI001906DE70|nr:trehalose-phosphatase [Halorhodospira abdelmalekii]MBK1735255.1 trehalose-phosphatase [Halorhodospira abdelmalekii]